MTKILNQLSPILNVFGDYDLTKEILEFLDPISKIQTLSITKCQESLRLELIKDILNQDPFYYLLLTDDDKHNKELIITTLLKKSAVIDSVPPKALECFTRDDVIKLLGNDASLFKYIPKGYRYDDGIILLCLKKKPKKIWGLIPIEKKKDFLKTNLTLVTEEDIHYYPYTLLQDAKQFIEQDVNNFQYFSRELRGNPEVIQKVKSSLFERIEKKRLPCLKKISDIILSNKNIMYDIILRYPSAVRFCSVLKQDRDIIIAAVSQYGDILEQASMNLRSDYYVVLAAVSQSGSALKHASIILKDNRDIVLEAVRQDGNSYKFASNRLKNDPEVVLVSYYNSRNFWHYYSDANKHIIRKNVFLSLSFLSLRDKKYKYQNRIIENVIGDEDLRKLIGEFL